LRPAPVLVPLDTLTVHPWPDPVIDSVGQHPCSPYVEQFWLGVLGPSTTFLLRHLVTGLDAAPGGYELPMAVTARRLGLGDKGGKHSPFMRSIGRLVHFELADLDDAGSGGGLDPGISQLRVRRRVPPLSRRQVGRLPEPLQDAHVRWQEEQLRRPSVEALRRRSRELALSYVKTGLDPDEAERQLLRLDFHPAMASEAARWAALQAPVRR
jgi:hypothetical protein